MARITQREYTITVNTFSDLFTLTNLTDNMDITVLDASGDIRTSGGTVVYVYLAEKTGIDAFIPTAEENQEHVVVEQETIAISGGTASLTYIPSNGVLLSAQARWHDDGIEIIEDVIYTLLDNVVTVDPYYNGKNLVAKYIRNESGKVVSLISTDGHLHTHNNKAYLDSITSLKTINSEDLRGVGNIIIAGGTAGNGLQIDGTGAIEINPSIVATQDDLGDLDLRGAVTTLSLTGDTLAYTDEHGVTSNIDLGKYLDDSNLVTSVAGKTGVVTLDKADVGLSNVDNTSDANKAVLSATKLATARTISLTGDVAGSVSFDGTSNASITATIQANSVALGTDTTGNYVAGATAGTGIVVSGTAGEGWSPTIALSNVGTAGTYSKVTTDAQGRVTSGSTLSASDIPSLDASKITSGTIDPARLPSYVDDVLEYANLAGFPVSGETGKIYVALDTNKTYRWSGSAYVYITSGAVDSVAGKTGVVTLDKADVGLSNVDNTSDANKPISTATQTALNGKQATLVSGTNIKTINGTSVLGSGNITIEASGGGAVNGMFWENGQTISSSYTLTSGKNAGTFGPITIADGVVVTIPDGSTWTVV